MRILNQMGPQVGEMISAGFPSAEVIAVPVDGLVETDLRADVLLSFRRASTMVEVAKHVPWLHVAGAGVEGLDTSVFDDDRIVTCSRGAHAIPISEFVLATIIAYEHRIPAMWISDAPPGKWMPLDELETRIDSGELRPPSDPVDASPERWGWMWTGELIGKTVGLVGLGGIGVAVAERAIAFGMDVVASRRTNSPSPLNGVRIMSSLEELLSISDHIVVCAPATPSTANLLNDRTLKSVKRGAHVINVARGSLIDEDALIRALDDGRLAMASLDVGVGEPLKSGHKLYLHPKIRLSPHVSWTSPRRQERVIAVFIDNLWRRQNAQELLGLVNPQVGY